MLIEKVVHWFNQKLRRTFPRKCLGMLTLQDQSLLKKGLFSDKTILLSITLRCLGILIISLMTDYEANVYFIFTENKLRMHLLHLKQSSLKWWMQFLGKIRKKLISCWIPSLVRGWGIYSIQSFSYSTA